MRVDSEAASSAAQWAIVEIIGNRRVAGLVREELLFGRTFVRIDIQWSDPSKGTRATQYYHPDRIYSFTRCDEAAARAEARYSEPCEPQPYHLPMLREGDAPEDHEFLEVDEQET